MKRKFGSIFALILALALPLVLLAGCGGGAAEEDPIKGAWNNDTIEMSMVFDGNGSVTLSDYEDTAEFTYEWDGETLTLGSQELGEMTTASLDSDGDLVFEDLDGFFVKGESAKYTPEEGAGTPAGGMEAVLEGDWTHSTGDYVLQFDGEGYVGYAKYAENAVGAGTYTYDGETLVITILDDEGDEVSSNGYLDSDGDIVIDLWGEGGYYVLNGGAQSSSSASVANAGGAEGELVGDWYNSMTGDSITFESDGSVTFAIDDASGYSSDYTFDGENLEFLDYTGHMDSFGDLVIDGVGSWFELQ